MKKAKNAIMNSTSNGPMLGARIAIQEAVKKLQSFSMITAV